jgi:RNA polymerase sigma factor (sigma-70 family)
MQILIDSKQPDSEIVTRSHVEPELFAELYRRHAAPLWRYAARRLGASLADDLVADTFLAAFRQRASYDGRNADARPWLYGIASNLIRRHRRTEVRQYRAFARSGVDAVTAPFADEADARVAAGAFNRALARALAGLEAQQRDPLLLVAWAELSYEETSRALGIPVGTVRSRVHRARAKLRLALGSDSPSDQVDTTGETDDR